MHGTERRLYAAAQVRELDRRAIQDHGIPGYTLMCRAAQAAWDAVRGRWPQLRTLSVVTGPGNNGGDGYEIARLAQAAGCAVRVFEVGACGTAGDAALARQAWLALGKVETWSADAAAALAADVVVDALYGTGLSRPPEGAAQQAIEAINAVRVGGSGVLAVDIPSGLFADTGAAPGAVVHADLTVSFIGLKFGLYTGQGPDCCGRIVFDSLGVAAEVYQHLAPVAGLLDAADLAAWLPPRARTSHKGSNGHVLLIGGDSGMNGAVLLAARAALRGGAGLVSVATRAEHAALCAAAQPEAMFRAVESPQQLQPLLERADVVAVGPGLGTHEWGRMMGAQAFAAGKPLVVDADALNLLAASPVVLPDAVLTPHPGEAGRLLGMGTAQVQADRAAAAAALRQRYGSVVVLKGAGTLVRGSGLWLCPYGNPGMGTGGMGDALTGLLAALLGQGLGRDEAACAAVLAHALSGDRAAVAGERGLLPSDLIGELRAVLNPGRGGVRA